MKKKFLIVGNWKMNTDLSVAEDLICDLADGLAETKNDVVVCPPAVFLEQCFLTADSKKVNNLQFGTQNIGWEKKGALTGEISIDMVEPWVKYVITGHSERRQYFAETSNIINKKIRLCLEKKITPILCVGEKRYASSQDVADIGRELSDSIEGLTKEELIKVVIAYEPVWAIGSGEAADAGYTGRIIAGLRGWIKDGYDFETAESIRFLYGGSVDHKNAVEYLSKDQVDGLLVGGASLKAKSFLKIVEMADKLLAKN